VNYLIDEKKADRALRFIKELKHTKGKWAGKKFLVLPWQEKIINDLYGTVNSDGTRQYRTAYIEIPKKNGKSELAAAIALKHLCADGEYGGEVYCCAADRDQAAIVFDIAKEMVETNSALRAKCNIIDSKKRITFPSTNSFLRVLSKEVKTKHGLNPSAIIFDELHAQPNDELWNVMSFGSMDARQQPLLFIITTAGTDEFSICKRQHDYAQRIIDGEIKDPYYYPVIFGASKKDDWKDPKVWAKANPSLGHTITVERLESACKRAQELKSEENLFRQLRLNQWVNQKSRWISMDTWNKSKEEFTEEDFAGERCYCGLDLSQVSDMTSYCLIFLRDGKYYNISRFFMPKDNLRRKELKDKVPYQQWVEDGHITATPGNTIDYEYIEAQFELDAQKFQIQRIGYDRWNSDYLVQNLQKKGMTTVPIGMGYFSMNAPTKRMENLVLQSKFMHNNNPVLSNHMDNTCVERDAAGNIKPSKAKSTQKIDGIVACIIGLAVFDEKTEESIYEHQGITLL